MAKGKRQALGRGLGSILPTDSQTNANPQIFEIPIRQIERNPYQPRQDFKEEPLDELAASIKVHGIIQPLTVRKLSDRKYQLISGERRLRASQIANLKEVPAYVRTADDEQMLEMALIENIQREDLNPIEIALTYQRMIDELGLKQNELGEKVGKKRATVTNYLSLLKLPEKIILGLREGDLSTGHAKAIKNIEDPIQQIQVFQDIVERGLSVRQAEEMARKIKQAAEPKEEKKAPPANPNDIHLREVSKQLEEKFATKVRLNQKPDGQGELVLGFNNTEDLNRLLELLDL